MIYLELVRETENVVTSCDNHVPGHRKKVNSVLERKYLTWSLSPEDPETSSGLHIYDLPLLLDVAESLATAREEEDESIQIPAPTLLLLYK